jgi:uncharacterized membrane protein
MTIQRIFKHLFFMDWQSRHAFPSETLKSIESAIQASEQSHAGEIRFVVEGCLEGLPLLRAKSARERAIEVFSQLRVWDTENNNGVLIYVLLADRAVEIVADRGIQVRTGSETWEGICRQMELAFSKSEFREGALQGIASIAAAIALNFPGQNKQVNELPDEPVLLT